MSESEFLLSEKSSGEVHFIQVLLAKLQKLLNLIYFGHNRSLNHSCLLATRNCFHWVTNQSLVCEFSF